MSKKVLLVSAVAAFVVCAACGRQDKAIEEAAYQYSFAMANYDLEGARPFATEETLNTTFVVAEALMNMVDSAYIASDTPATIEIDNLRRQSDTAATVTYHKKTPLRETTGELELRKRGGRWLAHAPCEEDTVAI